MVLPTRHDPFLQCVPGSARVRLPGPDLGRKRCCRVIGPDTGFVFPGRYDDGEFAAAIDFIRAFETSAPGSRGQRRPPDAPTPSSRKYAELVTTIHRQKQAAP